MVYIKLNIKRKVGKNGWVKKREWDFKRTTKSIEWPTIITHLKVKVKKIMGLTSNKHI